MQRICLQPQNARAPCRPAVAPHQKKESFPENQCFRRAVVWFTNACACQIMDLFPVWKLCFAVWSLRSAFINPANGLHCRLTLDAESVRGSQGRELSGSKAFKQVSGNMTGRLQRPRLLQGRSSCRAATSGGGGMSSLDMPGVQGCSRPCRLCRAFLLTLRRSCHGACASSARAGPTGVEVEVGSRLG